jgi:hypothetical protein
MSNGAAMAVQIAGDVQKQIAGYAAPIFQRREQNKALKLAQSTYDEGMNKSQGYVQPYYDAGKQGLQTLGDAMKNGTYNAPQYQQSKPFNYGTKQMQEDPAYQFQQAEGQKAVQTSAAAKGQALSGATMRAMQRYGTNLANQSFQQNREFGYKQYLNDLTQYDTEYQRGVEGQQGQYNRDVNMANYGERAGNTIADMWGQRANYGSENQLAHGAVDSNYWKNEWQAAYNQGQDAQNFGASMKGGGMGGGGSVGASGTGSVGGGAAGYSGGSGGTGVVSKPWYSSK